MPNNPVAYYFLDSWLAWSIDPNKHR